jgi:hypothetical protein
MDGPRRMMMPPRPLSLVVMAMDSNPVVVSMMPAAMLRLLPCRG